MTRIWAIILIALSTLLTSSAQVLYKSGVATLSFDIMSLLTNYKIISGFALYGIAAFMMLLAFKGGEVTVLYPIFATSFIWVALLSNIFFSEPLNHYKMFGIFSIIIGITFIAYGSTSGFKRIRSSKTRTGV